MARLWNLEEFRVNWAAWGPTIVSVLTMIFVAGKTYGRINGQELTLKRHDNWLIEHDGKISTLQDQAIYAKAWREGFDTGKAAAKPSHTGH